MKITGCMVLICAATAVAYADGPAWWETRGVVASPASTNDFAAVTQGQVKWIALKAKDELDAALPGGAGQGVAAVVALFSSTNNYLTLNLGQLKSVARPFYDRLIQAGYTNAYPWAGASSTNDFAIANIGQVKRLFSFDPGRDSDMDGLSDWWEMKWFSNLNETAHGDYDLDGITNLQEYQAGTSPTGVEPDVDGDGLSDAWEMRFFNSSTAANPLDDPDNDGWNNLQEFRRGGNPFSAWIVDAGDVLKLRVDTPWKQ